MMRSRFISLGANIGGGGGQLPQRSVHFLSLGRGGGCCGTVDVRGINGGSIEATAAGIPPLNKAATTTTWGSSSYHRNYHCSATAGVGGIGAHGNSGSRRYMGSLPEMHGTTILCIRKNGLVCMIGDGQVSMGSNIVKPNATKIRRIKPKKSPSASSSANKDENDEEKEDDDDSGTTIVGFAGSTADAFTLLERLEGKLDEYPGQLTRSCVELAKGWRTDKYLRRLEASLLVADSTISLELTGNGDVLESHDGVLGVGSGSFFAMAAARALMPIPDLDAEEIGRRAMEIASDMDVYTNKNFKVETLKAAAAEVVEEEDEDDEKSTVEEGKGSSS